MNSKTYSYKGFKFRQTDVVNANTLRFLYVIIDSNGDQIKPCGKRPFCTTIQECKDWINYKIACDE